MEIKKSHKIGIIIGIVIVISSFLFIKTKAFFLIFGVGITSAIIPFMISLMNEAKIAVEKEEMFLEFSRNLVESVKTGTSISKSIINVKNKAYGALGPNIEKLANQISMGIPLNTALQVFARDVNNKTISRAITLIGQAERAGGEIGMILESVTHAIRTSDKLKKERKSAISALVVQGYIIFLIFVVIILVLQFQILPMISGISGMGGGLEGISAGGSAGEGQDISSAFLYLLLIQGLFTGLTIGKLSEGNIKAGLKHSFALMFISFIVSSGANLFL